MPDAATLELWRVAEDGDVEELAGLLRRVPDINACNEHGMTALMRAAQNGRVKMVRALLEHGADANIKRNDKFTALALAAFFGHTEVVRTLMEHGADLQASTRGGTSPQMWATARTFSEVADQLDKPVAPQPAPVVKRVEPIKETAAEPVVRESPPRVVSRPPVVRTLKDPPEIWDLVHEAPRGFDARAAFLTRLKSMKTSFAFRAATAVVLIACCVVGVVVLRRVQARSERTIGPLANVAPKPIVSSQRSNTAQPHITAAPAAVTTSTVAASQPAVVPEPEGKLGAPQVTEPATPAVVRKFGSGTRVVSSHRVERGATRVMATEAAEPVTPPATDPQPSPRVEATAKPKASIPLSPQLITPAKTSTTKAKVIQWP